MATQTSLRYREYVGWRQKNVAQAKDFTATQARFIDELIDLIDCSRELRGLTAAIGDREVVFWELVDWYRYQERQVF